jgi:two-component system, NarL family, invasion response regulator UvrY
MPSLTTPIGIALVDDHTLFRKGLISLIEMVGSQYKIIFEADDGLQMQEKLKPDEQPDIIIMDVNMPRMDGFASVEWLGTHYPLIKILVVSMIEREDIIMRMVKLGVKGYLCKDVEPKELGEALRTIMSDQFYYTDFITGKLVHSLQSEDKQDQTKDSLSKINDREKTFLKYTCSELTYTEIAAKMFLSPKTIDGYRDALFEKLNIRSRVGLALFAVKHELVQL